MEGSVALDHWYKIQFTPVDFVKKDLNTLYESLGKLLESPIAGDDIAVFTLTSVQLPERIWLFPPKTVNLTKDLLVSYGAEPCEEPDQNEVAMEIGNQRVIDSFFSDKNKLT